MQLDALVVVNVDSLPLGRSPHRVIVQEACVAHGLSRVHLALQLHVDGVEEREMASRAGDENVATAAVVALDVRTEGRQLQVENLAPTREIHCCLCGA